MQRKDEILAGFLEIEPLDRDSFLKVKETLTRIGVPSKHGKTLYQSAHVLQSRGRYFIVHFKEMFKLDGKEADLSEEDLGRRNVIAGLLSEWGMIKPLAAIQPSENSPVLVVPHKYKTEWTLVQKYQLGNNKFPHK